MVTPEAGEDCEKLEPGSGLSMMGLCALYWMRMRETVGTENKSLKSYWLRLSETTGVVLRVQAHAGFSTAHRCLCELC